MMAVMTMPPVPLVLAAVMALAPLDTGQQARLAAWLEWAAAYRDCYEPAPFSLRIDRDFTAHCIERTLQQERGSLPEQRAATDALIAATPRLIAMLNTPAARNSKTAAAGLDPAPPTTEPAPGLGSGAARDR